MKAKVTQAFKYAVGGIRLIDISVGDVVEDDCAYQAVCSGWADELVEGGEKAKPAPENKALPSAPRNKGKG
jgi:hypothetical protein